jgi:FAD/FMN-containing dehydrogenase
MVPFEQRKTWRNHLGNQSIDPLRTYSPTTIAQVREIVRCAQEKKTTVRAVGSGHSWSDVALTPGFLIDTRGLNRMQPAEEPDFLRPEWAGRNLVRAEAGKRLKELNEWLDTNDLALSNMGGFDHQTIAGVISTSTHGSGIRYGPLNDIVRSLDIVAHEGHVYRVEPADGPTDPGAYAAHHRDGGHTLVQDDHWFNAVAVGMGSMGVVCTAMIEVEPKYYLREVRRETTWREVRRELEAGDVLAENEHYEVLFSPYARKREYPCLITTRNRTENPRSKWFTKRHRNLLVEAAALFPLTPHLINLLVDLGRACRRSCSRTRSARS